MVFFFFFRARFVGQEGTDGHPPATPLAWLCSPAARLSSQDEDEAAEKFSLELETKQLGELQESRNELLSRVSNLKRDLQDWRFKLDNQVKSYRSELGDLRKTLNSEVSQLRNEFQVRRVISRHGRASRALDENALHVRARIVTPTNENTTPRPFVPLWCGVSFPTRTRA